MVENEAFAARRRPRDPRPTYIALGRDPRPRRRCEPGEVARARRRIPTLIAAYCGREQGYTARRAMRRHGCVGDYDQLARFGEWDDGRPAEPEVSE